MICDECDHTDDNPLPRTEFGTILCEVCYAELIDFDDEENNFVSTKKRMWKIVAAKLPPQKQHIGLFAPLDD